MIKHKLTSISEIDVAQLVAVVVNTGLFLDSGMPQVVGYHEEHKPTDLLLELSSLTQTSRSAFEIIIINTNEQICFWNHHHKHQPTVLFTS